MDVNINVDSLLDEIKTDKMFHSPPKRKFKKISGTKRRNMGLREEDLSMVKTLRELREKPLNIVVAKALLNVRFVQNYFKEQELFKKQKYVMGLGVFQQLHYNDRLKQFMLKPDKPNFNSIYRAYMGENLDNKTLLISRTGGIGDLLFIKPNLNFLKNKYPTCKIKFACGPQYQPMVENWDCIDELLDLPFLLKDLISSDYHAFFEGVIERCKEAEYTNSYVLFNKWLGLEKEIQKSDLFPVQKPKEDLVLYCREILKEWGVEERNFILIQIRASSPVRTPSPKFWKSLFEEILSRGKKVILTDGPHKAEVMEGFLNTLDSSLRQNVFNFSKQSKTIAHTIALSSLSSICVATDTSLIHMGISVGRPAFGIYGPFPGKIRLETYEKCDWVDAKTKCTPCFIHSHFPCPQAKDGFSSCYFSLDIKDIVDKVENLMEKYKNN